MKRESEKDKYHDFRQHGCLILTAQSSLSSHVEARGRYEQRMARSVMEEAGCGNGSFRNPGCGIGWHRLQTRQSVQKSRRSHEGLPSPG